MGRILGFLPRLPGRMGLSMPLLLSAAASRAGRGGHAATLLIGCMGPLVASDHSFFLLFHKLTGAVTRPAAASQGSPVQLSSLPFYPELC